MDEQVVIEIKLGKLRGRIRQTVFSNKRFYSFQGIPFGKPPVGELRFKEPQPFGSWEGIRNALEDGNDCKQAIYVQKPEVDPNQVAEGNEDCLYICVYTGELPKKTNPMKPVMVNIHGGGFAGGSGGFNTAGPGYFLEEDIVLVSFNYRCGVFGFLSLENDEVPGNAGLKDQTLALQWVRDNIDSFGGDPDNVTIFGISAGGASVHYHLLSPLSKGLFHKAILQSGYSQNPWAFQSSPRKVALKLAKILGCLSEDSEEVLKFLRTVPSDDIVIASRTIAKDKDYLMCCGLVFSPTVEVAGSNKFLPDVPNNLMSKGEFNKVPTVLGICQNEGVVHLLFAMVNSISFEDIVSTLNSRHELLVPSFLKIEHGSDDEKLAQKMIWDFYLNGEPLSFDNYINFLKYQSDLLFNIGFSETRRQLLEHSHAPTFSYLFTNHTNCFCSSYTSTNVKESLAAKCISGTCHGADTGFMFTKSNSISSDKVTPEFKEAVTKHIRTWTNFALLGDPTIEELGIRWVKDSETSPCYMDIGSTWAMKSGVPFSERLDFWKELSFKYCTHS